MQAGHYRLVFNFRNNAQFMEPENLIRRLEYSFLSPRNENGSQLKLAAVKIDFEEAKFYLRGNWEFIAGRRTKSAPYTKPRNVEFEMNIFPASPVNLLDNSNDGLILFLKGSVKGEIQSTPSTGMVVFSKESDRLEVENRWNVRCYLYESDQNYLEIEFKLPVFMKPTSLPVIFGNSN
jgi:hypothetical protein